MKSKTIFLPFLLALLVAPAAFAQNHRASIRGRIIDPQGAVIPGATVNLISQATNETRTVTSDEEGEYAVSSLLPGPYRVEADFTNFKKYAQVINLQVNQEARLDINLEIGTITDDDNQRTYGEQTP
ncbi:MAG TPA: carboxypeptidase-like regulatory domain-containing protein, partial [Pyrinomonadaceae bacterium]